MNNRIKSSNVQLGESFNLDFHKRMKDHPDSELEKNIEQILAEAKNQKKAIIQDAEEKAAQLIKNAEEEVARKLAEVQKFQEEAVENGYKEGFQKGHDDGSAVGKEEILNRVCGLDALSSSAFTVKKEIVNSAEKEILELSLAIAEKIIREQIYIKPEIMEKIVKAAIEQLKDKEEIKIIVNPALTQGMYECAEEFKSTIKGLKSIKIIEDKTIPKDGVIVESAESRIDGRIESQLKEITKNIMQEYSENSLSGEIPKEIDIRIEDKLSDIDDGKGNG